MRRVAVAMNPDGCRRDRSSSSISSATGASSKGGKDGGCPEFPEAMPPLPASLLAIENFYYTAVALALPPRTDLGALRSAASSFCARDWQETLASWEGAGAALTGDAASHHAAQRPFLWRYCFGSALVWTLLRDVLGVPEDRQLVFTNSMQQLDGAEVGLDWALGAALCTLMGCTGEEEEGVPGGVVGGEGGAGGVGAGGAGGWFRAIGRARLVLLGAAAAGGALLAVAVALRRWEQQREPRRVSWIRNGGDRGGGGGGEGGGGGDEGRGGAKEGVGFVRGSAQMRGRSPSINGLRRLSTPSGSRRQLALTVADDSE